MCRRFVGAVLALVGAFGMAGVASADDLLVSLVPDRSGAVPLDGQELFGEVYIFFTTAVPEADVKDVEFFIAGTSEGKDNKVPYDLVGGTDLDALPFDSAKRLDDGPHLLEVVLTPKQGDPVTTAANFTVNNAGAPLDPGTDLQVIQALANLDAETLSITGSHFDAGEPPQVALGLSPLNVTGHTAETLEALLPEGLLPGDYVLNISTDGNLVAGLNDKDHVEMMLTVTSRDHGDLLNIGATSHADMDALISGLEASLATQQGLIDSLAADLQTANAQIVALQGRMTTAESDIGVHGVDIGTLQGEVATVQSEITAIETRPIFDLESYVVVTNETLELLEGPHVIFRGANVHVQSGSGATNDGGGELLGLGNLIVGYNEHVTGPHTGSHNLILGSGNQYASFGGLITGFRNRSFGPGGVLIGGYQNTATGDNSVVVGGQYSVADGTYSTIAAGVGNSTTTNGYAAFVAGGETNEAQSHMSSILGGFETVNPYLRGTFTGGVSPSQLGQDIEALDGTVTTTAALANTNAAGLMTAQQDISGLQTSVGQLDTTVAAQGAQLTTVQSDLDLAEASLVSLGIDVDAVELALGDVQASSIFDLEPYVVVTNDTLELLAGPHVIFRGANVHVQSGSGNTQDDGTMLGLGNLIVGYNEHITGSHTGSHNLILGVGNQYTSYGGIVTGYGNRSLAPGGHVLGGLSNTAEGEGLSVVLGGQYNRVSSRGSVIVAGISNKTFGLFDVVAGGDSNETHAHLSSVFGGLNSQNLTLRGVIAGNVVPSQLDQDIQSVEGTVTTVAALANTNAAGLLTAQQDISGLQTSVGQLDTTVVAQGGQLTTVQGDLDLAEASLASLGSDVDAVELALGEVQASSIFDLEPYVVVTNDTLELLAGPHVIFRGANVHVQSGSGATNDGGGELLGLGNLIVGYNEHVTGPHTGSHNLILGSGNQYASFGGLITGFRNRSFAPGGVLIGGYQNTVNGDNSVVLGGEYGVVNGVYSTLLAGRNEELNDHYGVLAGGVNPAQLDQDYQVLEGSVTTVTTLATGNQQDVLTLQGEMNSVQATASQNTSDVLDILNSSVLTLEPFVSVSYDPVEGLDGPHVMFEGANVHVRSGSGFTNDDGSLTGLGNLIIGYNDWCCSFQRLGAHNLVIGDSHEYTSYGGLVAGWNNQITGPSTSVTGGSGNQATFSRAVVTGGVNNWAGNLGSVVSGGLNNQAGGGGHYNWVGGGSANFASGNSAAVAGGQLNLATSNHSTVCGGSSNTSSGYRATVGGGANRTVSGEDDWAAGSLFEDN